MNEKDKKGELGENLVISYFISAGWEVVNRHNKYSPFDFMLIYWNNKHRIEKTILIDVKTKDQRTKYEDFGINKVSYVNYVDIVKSLSLEVLKKFYIFFVNTYNHTIYLNNLFDMEQSYYDQNKHILYPLKTAQYIYFHIDQMVPILTFNTNYEVVSIINNINEVIL